MDGENIYIKFPVIIDLHSQIYTLHKIRTLAMPLTNDEKHASIIQSPHDIIAINSQQQTYMLLTSDHPKHSCEGDKTYRCKELRPQYKVNSCELSLFQRNVNDIKELCNINIFEITQFTEMHYNYYNLINIIIIVHHMYIYTNIVYESKE